MSEAHIGRVALGTWLALTLVVGPVASAAAGPLSISTPKQLSVTGQAGMPQDMSGSRVVWTFHDGDGEVVVGDAATTASPIRITNNSLGDYSPRISGKRIVWVRSDGDTEIYLRDLDVANPVALTNNSYSDASPDIDGGRIVWEAYGPTGTDPEIRFHDVARPLAWHLTSNDWRDSEPRVSGGRVVWSSADPAGHRVLMWDLSTDLTSMIAGFSVNEQRGPDIDGSRVAWSGSSLFGYRIYVQTLGGALRTHTMSDGTRIVEGSVRLSGTLVAWSTEDGNNWFDLWVWDTASGAAPVKLDDGAYQTAQKFHVVDPYVVYEDSGEIYAWDRSSRTISRLTNNAWSDSAPVMGGNRLAWYANPGGMPNVYAATLVKSSPTIALSAPSTIAYGGTATVSGSLKWGTGALAERKVSLEYSYDNSTWSPWKTVTTNSSGAFVASAKPIKKTYYRAKFAGDAAFASKPSASTAVLPNVYLSRPTFGRSTLTLGTTYKARGYLKPRHTAGTYPVKIAAYRYSSGKYRYVKTYSAKAFDYSSYTKYVKSIKLPAKGKWRLRAVYPASATNATTYSSWRYVTVD